MNTAIFQAWIAKWDGEISRQNKLEKVDQKILFLVDKFSGHTVPECFLKNIQLKKFGPNLTSGVQPCDAGIIAALKAKYRAQFIHGLIRLFAKGKHGAELYKINLLSAIGLLKQAWYSLSKATIKNCWDHTRIVKFDDNVVM